ncbi:MAG: FlgO family outer membrane protein, partial [Chthoniobacterales bacterium]
MALLFSRSPEEPVQCALEICRELKKHPTIRVRMGVHSGPVSQVKDVNETPNIAGAGINVAQRVMDCGNAGHILLSKHVADDLTEYRHWQPFLRDLGECEVKHGLRLHLFNLCKDEIGNPHVPEKLQRRRWKSDAPIKPFQAGLWLKWVMIIALLAAAIAMGFFIFIHRQVRTLPPDKSIAVLPFENLSDEKENAFFAEGMQDEILTDLARVADLKVISRTSVMQYRADTKRNLRQIAHALGVAHILEGTVQRAGDRVKVSAQLIDARSDTHVWANKYERAVEDVFAIQSEVAEKIVDGLKSKLSPSEKAAIERPPTNDLAAYDLYVQGKTLIANAVFTEEPSKEKLLEAVQLLEQAVKRDPSFFLAYYQLAHAHDQIYQLGFDHTPARLVLADAAIQALLRLRPDSGETHLAMAKHLYWGYLDYDRARAELEAAQQVLPNDVWPFLLAGYMDRRQGHWKESTHNMERALELDPQNLLVLHQMSLTYECLRYYQEMAATLDRALALAPDQIIIRGQRAFVDLDWRADTKPLHSTIELILHEKPSAAPQIADQWLYLALCERDPGTAARALALLPPDGCNRDGIPFPVAWCESLVARAKGDLDSA